ncbi:MAG: beta-glucosidase [Frankiales bacterium]|jgi:beta-glucosidase|nr:beta-glucosidase [Frankiales bacterium]
MGERVFPESFVWGTATAAHQIEGGNDNNDWWDFEHAPGSGVAEPSGDACDSWHRWPEDVALVADMGLSTYRFSLEWSRIQPAPGEWNHDALLHYRAIAEACRERGIEPMVTLHHFTTPRWAVTEGGWEDDRIVERFATYVESAVAGLADVVDVFFTLNEPNAMALMGWMLGEFVPGKKDVGLASSVMERMRAAHTAGMAAIRAVAPGAQAGLTLAMLDWQAEPGGEDAVAGMRGLMDDPFLDLARSDHLLGVQTYTRLLMGAAGPVAPPAGAAMTQLGYEVYPDALEATVRYAWARTGGSVPLMVTENGIGTGDDAQRIEYTRGALTGLARCLADDIDVRGYLHWSLLDNFEWSHGYGPTFGLVAVDRSTFERTPKPSASWYAEVARTGTLP